MSLMITKAFFVILEYKISLLFQCFFPGTVHPVTVLTTVAMESARMLPIESKGQAEMPKVMNKVNKFVLFSPSCANFWPKSRFYADFKCFVQILGMALHFYSFLD